jgi:RNA polymerase sigma-70 factor (ECF subfamily)
MLETPDLERFVDDYADAAYRFAYALCGNEPDARELVQGAFVRVFDKAALFDGTQSLEAWFKTVLKNMFLDGRRAWDRKHKVSLDAPIGEGLTVADAVADPRDAAVGADLEREETAAGVRAALAGLPAESRAVLTLVDMEGLGYEETARRLGLPLGTVRSRLSRARAALRELALELEVTP